MRKAIKTSIGQGITRRRFLQGSAALMGGLALQRARSTKAFRLGAASTFRLGPMGQTPAAVSVMDAAYGAKGDGQTNDRDAFQAAIDAAIDAGLPLLIPKPPQFYRIILDPNHDRLLVNGDLAVVGEGRDTTTLRRADHGRGA